MYILAGKLWNLAPQNWGLPAIPLGMLLVRTLFDFSLTFSGYARQLTLNRTMQVLSGKQPLQSVLNLCI